MADITDEVYRTRSSDLNVKALFCLARDFGMRMPEGSAIVNLSSVAGKASASTDTLCYGASKAAVLSVTRSLAYYLGPRGVRVNAVLPGITDTPMQERFLVEAGAIRGLSPGGARCDKRTENRCRCRDRPSPPRELGRMQHH